MKSILILVLIMGLLVLYSLMYVAGRSDRMMEQLMFESQSKEGGDSSVG